MAQVAGRARITIDGVSVPTAGDVKLETGSVTREPVNGDYETDFKETLTPSKLEAPLLARESVDAIAIGKIKNATIVVAWDNGQTYVIRSAFAEGAPPLGDGKLSSVFYGKPAELVS